MFRDVRAEIRDTFQGNALRYTSQRHAMLEYLWRSACPVRYDVNAERHHHFIRERCKSLEDIAGFAVSGLLRQPQPGSRIARRCDVVFRGICERCSQRSNSRTARRR